MILFNKFHSPVGNLMIFPRGIDTITIICDIIPKESPLLPSECKNRKYQWHMCILDTVFEGAHSSNGCDVVNYYVHSCIFPIVDLDKCCV